MQIDFDDFRKWIKLSYSGKRAEDFDDFWQSLFVEGLPLKDILARFSYLELIVDEGPITSWLKWLRDSLLVYIFVKNDTAILELSVLSDIPLSKLAVILRNFFIWKFPHKNECFSKFFNLANLSDLSAYSTFKDLMKEAGIRNDFNGVCDDDLMYAMDVSLYESWPYICKKIKKHFTRRFNLKKLKLANSSKKFFYFVRDVIILVTVALALIWSVRRFNVFYENYLSDKIRLFEPAVLKLDTVAAQEEIRDLRVSEVPTIEEIEEKEKHLDLDFEIERNPGTSLEFGTESELAITSWDSLPKDFDIVKLETSVYEDISKGEYRYSTYGTKLNYRVVINSIDPLATREKIDALLARYNATQADNVKPGTEVPGGFYYNLFVAQEYIKEFLAQAAVTDSNVGVIYLNRTRRDNPPGLIKVFIWLKRY